MNLFHYFNRRFVKWIFIFLLPLLTCCSIKDSLDDCPPQQELLYIEVKDILTGEDITGIEELENLTLYFFDRNESFATSLEILPSQINDRLPIDVTGMNLDGGYVSAWGNVNDLIRVPTSRIGETPEEMRMMLVPNTLQENHFLCPGDLFFGYQRLNFEYCEECRFVKEETVEIMRKNSQLYVTVRGLGEVEDATPYYFRINTREGGYDFEGTPVLAPIVIREVGIMNDVHDYVSPEPYIMIHSDLEEVITEENSVSIHFFQTGSARATDHEIIMANKDINGEYIRFEPGRTTNVLMELVNGEAQIQVVITEWGEIHQWETW